MSLRKIKTPYRSEVMYRGHVDRLIHEIEEKAQSTSTLSEPKVIEEYVGNTERFSVTVIWDSWTEVERTSRGEVILDAYEHSSRSQDVFNINATLGVTPAEAEAFGIRFQSE